MGGFVSRGYRFKCDRTIGFDSIESPHLRFPLEERMTNDQFSQDTARTPDIHRPAVLFLAEEEFWGAIP